MFAIIITEKGGTERREVFDRTEINVGRVQGNELMLPKGNVSKHHARLLYRDGRFIVTDLKSTNGTYVNGRKITQATIVREGDKIYIGDFILRLEIPPQQSPLSQGLPEEAVDQSSSSSRSPSPQEGAPSHPPALRPSQEGPVSHYPLENDPDEQSWSGDRPQPPQPALATAPQQPPAAQLRVPAPPRLPSAPARERRSTAPSSRASGSNMLPLAPSAGSEVSSSGVSVGRPSSPSSGARAATPPRESSGQGTHDSMQVPARRLAAVGLVARIEEAVDLGPLRGSAPPPKPLLDRIERTLRDAANAMRSSGELPPQLDLEAAITEAREELVGLGPLQALLADEDVVQVHIHRHGWVSTLRASGPRRTETPFASEGALERILRRLCAREGAPIKDGEVTVERQLQGGTLHLLALFPPVAHSGAVATLRKCMQPALNLDDLVRSGAMSRAVASFLTHVVAGQANVLLNASTRADMFALLGAMISAVRPSEHLVVAHGPSCGLTLPRNATTVLLQPGEKGAQALRAAAQLAPDRLVVAGFDGAVTAEVLDAVAAGAQGVIAATQAPTVRHALARMVPESAAHRPGIPVEAIREWVNASFDVTVEYARMRDGRARVVRVGEPAGVEGRVIAMRDIFTFTVERTASGGTVEGSFHPTGVVPKIAEDLQARGLALEPSLFRR